MSTIEYSTLPLPTGTAPDVAPPGQVNCVLSNADGTVAASPIPCADDTQGHGLVIVPVPYPQSSPPSTDLLVGGIGIGLLIAAGLAILIRIWTSR